MHSTQLIQAWQVQQQTRCTGSRPPGMERLSDASGGGRSAAPDLPMSEVASCMLHACTTQQDPPYKQIGVSMQL